MSPRDLPPPVPVTALRVYEPLEAFAAGERRALAALADDPDAGSDAEIAERRTSWRRLLGRPDLPPAGAGETGSTTTSEDAATHENAATSENAATHENAATSDNAATADVGAGDQGRRGVVRTGGLVHARVLKAEGVVLVSPVPLPPAAVAGEAVGGGTLGGDHTIGDRAIGDRAISDDAVGTTPADTDRRARHALVQAWELPVAWLVVVRSEDLTRSGGPGRYVLPMARARARAARALRTLRTGLGDTDVTAEVEELARWLEGFHPRSWVEVDARPVAALVGGEDGADDVRMGLESLAAGDAAGVAAAYQRVSKRSHRLEQLSVSS